MTVARSLARRAHAYAHVIERGVKRSSTTLRGASRIRGQKYQEYDSRPNPSMGPERSTRSTVDVLLTSAASSSAMVPSTGSSAA
jgi:hypothetical protein